MHAAPIAQIQQQETVIPIEYARCLAFSSTAWRVDRPPLSRKPFKYYWIDACQSCVLSLKLSNWTKTMEADCKCATLKNKYASVWAATDVFFFCGGFCLCIFALFLVNERKLNILTQLWLSIVTILAQRHTSKSLKWSFIFVDKEEVRISSYILVIDQKLSSLPQYIISANIIKNNHI